MKNKILFITLITIFYFPEYSLCQTDTVLSNAYLCDTTAPYKLVFYDEFIGYTDQTQPYGSGTAYNPYILNPYKWDIPTGPAGTPVPFGTGIPSNPLLRASNVIPNDGTGACILNVDLEAAPIINNTPCSDCPPNQYYVGEIESVEMGAYFNKGRFEASISYPSFYFAHSNFFLAGWDGNPYISAPETYGDPLDCGSALAPSECGHRHMEVSTGMGTHQDNERLGADWAAPSYYDYTGLFDHYHTYICEWDENFMKFYIDDTTNCVKLISRWDDNIYCWPPDGHYNRDPSFPDEGSLIHMMMQCWPDHDGWGGASGPVLTTPLNIGQMKIDWVRVYQQHPDAGHHDLCSRWITGNNTFCSLDTTVHTFTLVGPGAISTGNFQNWAVSPHLTVVDSGWNSIKVTNDGFTGPGWITYTDDNPVCPVVELATAYGPPPDHPVTEVTAMGTSPVGSPPDYLVWYWTIPYTGYTYYWSLPYLDAIDSSCIAYHGYNNWWVNTWVPGGWELTVTNSCGSGTVYGPSPRGLPTTPCQANELKDSTQLPYIKDAVGKYMTKLISNYANVADSSINKNAINDSICAYIAGLYDEVNAKYDSIQKTKISSSNDLNKAIEKNNSITRIYPNPVVNELNIFFNSNYMFQKNIGIKIMDINSKIVVEKSLNNVDNKMTISLGNLIPGSYLLQINQGEIKENFKFTKD